MDGKHQDLSSMDFDDGLIPILVKDNLRTNTKYMHQYLRRFVQQVWERASPLFAGWTGGDDMR